MHAALSVAAIAVIALVSSVASAQSSQSPPTAPEHAPRLVQVAATLTLTLGPRTKRCKEELLRSEVATLLGYDPFAPGAPGKPVGSVHVEITVPEGAKGYAAKVEFFDASGVAQWKNDRNVQGTDARACGELLRGVATDIMGEYTIVNDSLDAPPSPSLPPSVPPSLPPGLQSPTLAPPREPVAPPTVESKRLPRIEIGASAHVAIGTAPHATPGGALHVGVVVARFDRTSILAGAEGRLDAGATTSTSSDSSIRTQLFAASVVLCADRDLLARARITWGVLGCVLGTAGDLRGVWQQGTDRLTSQNSLYAAVGGRIGLEVRPSIVALRVQLDVAPTLRAARAFGPGVAVKVGSVSGCGGLAIVLPL